MLSQSKAISRDSPQSSLSVVIPVKNNFQHLRVAIASVLRQEYPYQVIVVDDGSTPSLLPRLKKDYPQVLALRNKKSQGPAAARNRGLKHVKGDYVSFLDSDDFWKPNFAQIMVAACQEGGGAVLCFSSRIFSKNFGLKQKIIFRALNSFRDLALIFMLIYKKRALFKDAFFLAQVSHVVFSRKAISGIVFDESYKFGEDWRFIVEIQKKVKIKILPKRLLYFRYHHKSLSFRNKEKWLFYRKLLGDLPPVIKDRFFVKLFSLYINLFSKFA